MGPVFPALTLHSGAWRVTWSARFRGAKMRTRRRHPRSAILAALSGSRRWRRRITRGLPLRAAPVLLPLGGRAGRLAGRSGSSLRGMPWLAAWMPGRLRYFSRCRPGARARLLAEGELAGLAAGLPRWRELAGISDGLLIADGRGGDAGARGERGERGNGLSLDDGLLGSWTGPFGWLVVAEPLGPAELEALAEETGRRERLAAASADRFPEREAQARRLKERHAELRRGRSEGFWRIRVAVGAADEVSAARVAGLFCAVTDLGGLPYALSPAPARPSGAPMTPGTPRAPHITGARPAAADPAATARRPPRSTGRRRCSRPWPGRLNGRYPGCASRCGRTST